VLDRDFVRPAGGLAVRAQVAGDHFSVLREKLDLVAPVFVTAEKAMHEDQRRGAAPLVNEMQA
jgi:hypothetical protein